MSSVIGTPPAVHSSSDPDPATPSQVARPRPDHPVTRPSRALLAFRAFMRDRMAAVAAVILLLTIAVAILAPVLSPYDPIVGDSERRLEGIGTDGHLLGLDGQGRDILSRLIWGARYSLSVAVFPVLLVLPIALVIGLVAGYAKGRIGATLMRLLDVLFAFPLVLLAIALAAVLGAGLGNVMLAISISLIPYLARVAYTATVQESSREYVEAARAGGARTPEILFKELLPNVVSPLLVYATTLCGLMVVLAAGLSFLGVGIIPPTPDWGIMTADGASVLLEGHAHVATIPGFAILVVALSFNLLGDGVRDALDPRKQTT
ncbi:MAG: ABC transporter permease [Dietzia sp.]